MGDRAVYCARLESVCAERYPGFESPPIRQVAKSVIDAALTLALVNLFCSVRLDVYVSRQGNP
jgi:hypothetical protein